MDDDMSYSEDDSTRSESPYDSYHSYHYYARSRSPPRTPERPEPITHYDLQYVDSVGGASSSGKCIDLVFVMDCTGSMQRYINATRDHIYGICDMIRGEEGLGGPDDLRVAVVNYRDYPPQDHTYVYKFHPFSSDISEIQQYLRTLTAAGGGDGPEAVTAGMAACLTELQWRREAAKMVVLIADAPPHGIGESGDQIKTGDPDGHDPLVIARTMAQHGIVLFMVACEETLSGYSRAVDFFTALCTMTSGVMLPLTTADLLATTIVGSVLENMDMERLIAEIGNEVAQRIKQKGESMQSVEEVAQELHERLLLRNEQTKQFNVGEVYVPHENAKRNVQTWMNAQYAFEAALDIVPVPGKRLTERFREQNRNSGYRYVPGGKLPPRKKPATTSTGVPIAPTTPPDSRKSSPDRSGTSPGSSSSPRKVVSSFKAFGASSPSGGAPSLSVFGAKMLPTGPGGGMFGNMGKTPMNSGIRDSRGAADDDDDDDDEDGAGGQFKKDSISLDQARRIATQSVFRAGRLG